MGTPSKPPARVSAAQPRGTRIRSAQSPTPSQVLENVQTIADLEAKSSAQRSALDRFSDRVSGFASSTSFLIIHVLWFAGWVGWNTVARKAIDPYPFTFLTLLTSLEAIFLTSFVLIS